MSGSSRFSGKFTRFEKVLIMGASVLFVSSSILYFSGTSVRSQWTQWEAGETGTAFGHVKTAEGNLRRRLNTESAFRDVARQAPLFSQDTLITGPNAGATLELDDGTEIQMDPSTLVRLSFASSVGLDGIARRATIDVLSGAASGTAAARSTRTVILRTAGKETKISKDRAPVRVQAKSPPIIAPIPVSTPTPAPTPALAVVIAPSPTPTPSPSPSPTPSPVPLVVLEKPVLLAPKLDGKALIDGSYTGAFPRRAEVVFSWKPQAHVDHYVLTITPRGPKSLRSARLVSKGTSVAWRLPATYSREWTYTLAALPTHGRTTISEPAHLAISYFGPEPRNPSSGAKIDLKLGDKNAANIIFTWPRWPIAESYLFEVASNPVMTQIVQKQERAKNENFAALSPLRPGTYWWTVRARAKDGSFSTRSRPRLITVK